MIGLEDRHTMVRHIETAHAGGARLRLACEVAGITVRTLQRWKAHDGLVVGDRRPGAERPTPAHALSIEERERILAVANEPRFADMPPARIVPMLADEGVYLASESSFGRVLRAHGQTQHRGRAKAPRQSRPPTTHVATGPRQLWCWDMTYLPAEVAGRWFYLYLILDVYSRKIVGFEVHDRDDADHAAHLVKRTALAEGIHAMAAKPVLHGDNGATLKATTVLAMLHWLGVKPSYSRPRVSDDNAFVESLFRTAKYRPEFPSKGFADLAAARTWAAQFVHWYNHEHRFGKIPSSFFESINRAAASAKAFSLRRSSRSSSLMRRRSAFVSRWVARASSGSASACVAAVRHCSNSCGYTPFSRHQAFLLASSIAAVASTASNLAAAVHARSRAGMDIASARQRSSVATATPNSLETTSTAALSGGNNRATARSLNSCP